MQRKFRQYSDPGFHSKAPGVKRLKDGALGIELVKSIRLRLETAGYRVCPFSERGKR
jgi:hypothetical protein